MDGWGIGGKKEEKESKKRVNQQGNKKREREKERLILGVRLRWGGQTKEEKPAVGACCCALQPRLLGGRYRVLCWLGGSEDSSEGVGVRLPFDLNRVPCWTCWPGWTCGPWSCGEGALWGSSGGSGGMGGGWGRDSCSTSGSACE